jgi:3-hydroxyisobutyrate dehydrogenase
MSTAAQGNLGWVGIGRMGLPMVTRLLAAGYALKVWNRTAAKAEPLVAKGATIVPKLADLRSTEIVFTMLATGKDLLEVCFGAHGLVGGKGNAPKIIVDCSTIGIDESGAVRAKLAEHGVDYLAAPVSGNGKCVTAGKLSCVVSGKEAAYEAVKPMIETFAVRGSAYVGEGELARVCKIAHNVMLAVVMENLMEVTLLAQKAGVPRHAFLKFINNSVVGSIFTQYKSPALVNLDWTTTFTPVLLKKDIDLGLESGRKYDVPMPVTAAAREVLQSHFGAATLKHDPAAYLQKDFAALLETMALGAGVKLESENVAVPSGLEV